MLERACTVFRTASFSPTSRSTKRPVATFNHFQNNFMSPKWWLSSKLQHNSDNSHSSSSASPFKNSSTIPLFSEFSPVCVLFFDLSFLQINTHLTGYSDLSSLHSISVLFARSTFTTFTRSLKFHIPYFPIIFNWLDQLRCNLSPRKNTVKGRWQEPHNTGNSA